MKILLAEDDNLTREALALLLEGAGHRVEPAADGKDALRQLRAGAFDLLVLDVLMPEMGGLEVVGLLEAQGPRVPIVLLTAVSDAVRLTTGGLVRAVVRKPCDVDALLSEIERVGNAGTEDQRP